MLCVQVLLWGSEWGHEWLAGGTFVLVQRLDWCPKLTGGPAHAFLERMRLDHVHRAVPTLKKRAILVELLIGELQAPM